MKDLRLVSSLRICSWSSRSDVAIDLGFEQSAVTSSMEQENLGARVLEAKELLGKL